MSNGDPRTLINAQIMRENLIQATPEQSFRYADYCSLHYKSRVIASAKAIKYEKWTSRVLTHLALV